MNLSARWVYWAAVLLLVAPLCLGAATWLVPAAAEEDEDAPRRAIGADSALPLVGVDSFEGRARRTAPFRPDGRPSGVAYDPTRSEMPSQGYTPPKPLLTLNGVMDGASPLALVEGIPGQEGPAVLGVGDTLGGLRVRRIKGGEVTVTGLDTTWTLRIREQ